MRAYISILILVTSAIATGATMPIVTLKATAAVLGPSFTLAEVATVQGTTDETSRIGSALLGRAPMLGASRSITRADVGLKLRQAGIDPATISFAGSDSVQISLLAPPAQKAAQVGPSSATTATSMVAASGNSAGETPAASNTAAIAPAKPQGLNAGDSVTVIYDDGPVRITVTGTLANKANVGDKVSVNTPISSRLLKGTLIDLETVRI